MRKARGIALFTILVVTTALLAILSLGLKMGSNGVLFVSQAHKRNVALGAAEAGVYEAMVRIEGNKAFNGAFNGTLADSGGDYTVEVDNQLLSTGTAQVRSVGEYGGVRRYLEVELEPDASGYGALSLGGKVYIFDRAYINGITSTREPRESPGNAYTEFDIPGTPSFKGEDYDGDGSAPYLHVSGQLATQGSFDPGLSRVSELEQSSTYQPRFRFDKAAMTSGTFSNVATMPSGVLGGNTRVTDSTATEFEATGTVIVPKGVTLVIEGDARFLGGISGEGTVVVNGDAVVRANDDFNPNLEEGLKVFVDGSAFILHPEASLEAGVATPNPPDHVGNYFAQMPPEASLDLPVALPVAAPRGGDFFTWFDTNIDSPSADFDLWYNGDGTDIYPGQTTETKLWLQNSRPIHADIASWANE